MASKARQLGRHKPPRVKGAVGVWSEDMNLKQQIQRRDYWLHFDFNVAIAIVVAVTLITYVVSKFAG